MLTEEQRDAVVNASQMLSTLDAYFVSDLVYHLDRLANTGSPESIDWLLSEGPSFRSHLLVEAAGDTWVEQMSDLDAAELESVSMITAERERQARSLAEVLSVFSPAQDDA